MQPYEYITMHRYEDHYWWYAGLRGLLDLMFKNYIQLVSEISLLDAGCGTGGNLAHLAHISNRVKLFAMEIYSPAIGLTNSRETKATLLQASVNQVPFKKDTFDVITCFDVLYIHGVDDDQAFREFYRTLKPDGILLVNLPAHELLRGELLNNLAYVGGRQWFTLRNHG